MCNDKKSLLIVAIPLENLENINDYCSLLSPNNSIV